MPVEVVVEPLTSSLDLYDTPSTAAAYSLSGHIAITLTPSTSLLGLARPAPQNLLLTSLELTFEGQSELVLTDVGYTPLRLISLTKELVAPSEPVHISCDDDAASDRAAEWRVVFDLTLPGWLPASAVFGDDEQSLAGVSYALFARARFLTADPDADDAPPPSVWTNLCAAVRLPARPRAVHAEKVAITLARAVPARPDARATYAVEAVPRGGGDGPTTNIPADVLRSVQLHAIVPCRTSIADAHVPLALRVRSTAAGAEADARLRVLGFEADVVQVETFHTSPSASYTARFPLPAAPHQPPARPLKSAHPIGALFELGLIGAPAAGRSVGRERSLVRPGCSKLFRVRGASVVLEQGWLRMEVEVPLVPGLASAAGESPLRDVRHEMRVRVTVGCGEEEENVGSDELAFVVPLEMVHVARAVAFPTHSSGSLPLARSGRCEGSSVESSRARTLSTPAPALPPLPAYSQLFHENGEQRDEWLSALPVYREKADAEEAAAAAEEEAAAAEEEEPESPLPRTPRRWGPGHKFGESFLRFDEEEDEVELGADAEVQYGIAY